MKKDDEQLAIWQCDCRAPHFMTFTWSGKFKCGWLEICGSYRGKGRLRTAWEVLRHGHSDWVDVHLTDPEKIRDLAANLLTVANSLEGVTHDDAPDVAG